MLKQDCQPFNLVVTQLTKTHLGLDCTYKGKGARRGGRRRFIQTYLGCGVADDEEAKNGDDGDGGGASEAVVTTKGKVYIGYKLTRKVN